VRRVSIGDANLSQLAQWGMWIDPGPTGSSMLDCGTDESFRSASGRRKFIGCVGVRTVISWMVALNMITVVTFGVWRSFVGSMQKNLHKFCPIPLPNALVRNCICGTFPVYFFSPCSHPQPLSHPPRCSSAHHLDPKAAHIRLSDSH
jgi:hypothetical protein